MLVRDSLGRLTLRRNPRNGWRWLGVDASIREQFGCSGRGPDALPYSGSAPQSMPSGTLPNQGRTTACKCQAGTHSLPSSRGFPWGGGGIWRAGREPGTSLLAYRATVLRAAMLPCLELPLCSPPQEQKASLCMHVWSSTVHPRASFRLSRTGAAVRRLPAPDVAPAVDNTLTRARHTQTRNLKTLGTLNDLAIACGIYNMTR